MSRPRLALLNAAHDPVDTTRNFRRELDADVAEFHAVDGDLPEHFEFDGVVVTGSRSSVYWDEEWIPSLLEYVQYAHEHGVPVLGVCFGHQVLAEALGGRVAGMGEYEIGYREVTHDDDALFEGIDRSFTVFTSHQDRVEELPPGATLLAENDYGVHAFRSGDRWGVQFHPEYDMETAEDITRGKDLSDEKFRRVLDGISAENYDAAREAKRLFDNFVDRARRRRDATAAVGSD